MVLYCTVPLRFRILKFPTWGFWWLCGQKIGSSLDFSRDNVPLYRDERAQPWTHGVFFTWSVLLDAFGTIKMWISPEYLEFGWQHARKGSFFDLYLWRFCWHRTSKNHDLWSEIKTWTWRREVGHIRILKFQDDTSYWNIGLVPVSIVSIGL